MKVLFRNRNFILALSVLFILIRTAHAQITPTSVDSIPMSDGKKLAADVYVPSGCSSCPTILIQTPYNKNLFRLGLPLGTGQNLNASSYSWVIVDWRGFYGSSSASVPSANRGKDGYDVIDWIISQPWSNGKVGTWGPSALGVIQFQTAREKHPNHICAVPVVAHPQTDYDSYYFGGVLEESRLKQLDVLGYGLSPFVLGNPYYNLVWQFAEAATWYPSDIQIPMLYIGGWYDHNIDKMMTWFEDVKAQANVNVRDEQWLLVGPWVHGGKGVASVGSSTQGELSYPNAEKLNDTMASRFLAHYLLNENNNWENTPAITYYNLGEDVWESSVNSSIEESKEEELFLDVLGAMSTEEAALSREGQVPWISDPHNPVPTIGGPTLGAGLDQGPYDQKSLEGRPDVLTFSTAELLEPVHVSGRVRARLVVTTDQPDGDIMVRLVDQYPDGRDMMITDGAYRMRFIKGFEKSDETFLVPNAKNVVHISLPFVNYTWKEGHRIKIYVSASSDSRWNINLQNGDSMYTAGDTLIANMKIDCGSIQPSSSLFLPTQDELIVGLEKYQMVGESSVYPNPVSTSITLKNIQGYDQFEIIGLDGRIWIANQLEDRRIDLDIIPPGLYKLKLTGQSKLAIISFIKE